MVVIVSESILNEGAREINELKALASEILGWFATNNWDMIERMVKNGITKDTILFHEDFFSLKELKNQYKWISPLVDNNPMVVFSIKMSSKGMWVEHRNLIRLKNDSAGFVRNMRDSINEISGYVREKGITAEEGIPFLKKELIMSFGGTLVHELQHAYDYYRSNSKYTSDKKSVNYYNRKEFDANDPESQMDLEEKKIYLTLPHEYWARFSQTVTGISNWGDFNRVKNIFVNRIGGWDLLSDKVKKRLLGALWKYHEYQLSTENNR